MEDPAIRNFRDFLTIYNQMAETCFNRCVSTLNYRTLTPDEEECVEKCANKHVNINHKMMSIYMEVQPQMISKRAEEMNKQMEEQAAMLAAKEKAENNAQEQQTVEKSDSNHIS